ncbi:MAG TPA: BadF/BadG/BcrA/BcrD ATPase family protein [Candidatus Limnocylindria bacterium]|nr:BadF/BadG/BcrA/BcrD ATPase family protein [Candidatus Limnocylindria bacterium]
MSLILGVDGGNSKAIALVARTDGSVLGAARRLGAADIYAEGPDAALAVTRAAVHEALARAEAGLRDIGQAVFSMAGADWPEDFALLTAALADDGFGGPVTVVNDAIGALAGAVPEGPAVVVSIGTGAATGARGADGALWHSSFWQAPQGAGELAHAALAAVVRSELGILPPAPLREALLAATGDADVEAALHRFTARSRLSASVIGPVVRALLTSAEEGDPVALAVVESHGTGLGEIAAAAARRVGIGEEAYALSFCGGLARAGAEVLVGAAVAAVEAAGQSPVRVPPRWEPAVGAVVIGLHAAGVAVVDEVAARLDETAPDGLIYDVHATESGPGADPSL